MTAAMHDVRRGIRQRRSGVVSSMSSTSSWTSATARIARARNSRQPQCRPGVASPWRYLSSQPRVGGLMVSAGSATTVAAIQRCAQGYGHSPPGLRRRDRGLPIPPPRRPGGSSSSATSSHLMEQATPRSSRTARRGNSERAVAWSASLRAGWHPPASLAGSRSMTRDRLRVWRTPVVCIRTGRRFLHPDHRRTAAIRAGVADQPDVVHFHNLSGLGFSLIPLVKRYGLPAIVTLHDHAGYCYRATALRPDGSPCRAPEGALACSGAVRPREVGLALPMRPAARLCQLGARARRLAHRVERRPRGRLPHRARSRRCAAPDRLERCAWRPLFGRGGAECDRGRLPGGLARAPTSAFGPSASALRGCLPLAQVAESATASIAWSDRRPRRPAHVARVG